MRPWVGLIVGSLFFVALVGLVRFYFGESGMAVALGVLVLMTVVLFFGRRVARRRVRAAIRERRHERRESAMAAAELSEPEFNEALPTLDLDEREKARFVRLVQKLRRDGIATAR
jgi:hypothetical protein